MPSTQPDSQPDKPVAAPKKSAKPRWIALLLLAVAAVAAGLACKEFLFTRPIGTGPAGPAVDRSAFASQWSARKVHVVGVGDSITAGLGAKTSDHRSFDRLITCPEDEAPEMQGICLSAVLPNLTFENTAVSGSNSLDHLGAVQEDLQQYPVDTFGIVLMTSGGNDLIHWYGTKPPREGAMYGATLEQAAPWIQNYADRLDKTLDAITERFPGGCHIFLGDIYDPTDGSGNAGSVYLPAWDDGLAIHGEYNRVIHEAAERRAHVHVVPLHETFLGHGIACRRFWNSHYCREDPTFWYYGNIEDPNDRGHDAVRRAFLNAIVEALHSQIPEHSAAKDGSAKDGDRTETAPKTDPSKEKPSDGNTQPERP